MDRDKVDNMLCKYIMKEILSNSTYILEHNEGRIRCIDLLCNDETLDFPNIEECLIYWFDSIGEVEFKTIYGADSYNFAKYLKGKIFCLC